MDLPTARPFTSIVPFVCILMIPPGLAAQAASSDANIIILNNREASSLIVQQIKPEYPAIAKLNYIQGSVRLRLRITDQGRVGDAHVIRGHPFLAAESLGAVRQWIYRVPKNGLAKNGFLTFVDVNFRLRERHVERLPPQPERDLNRQVQPPSVVPNPDRGADVVGTPMRVRVLVGPDGRALDVQPASGRPADLAAARKVLEHWKFHPARWGNHPVPWYLEVELPTPSSRALPALRRGGVPQGGRQCTAPVNWFECSTRFELCSSAISGV